MIASVLLLSISGRLFFSIETWSKRASLRTRRLSALLGMVCQKAGELIVPVFRPGTTMEDFTCA